MSRYLPEPLGSSSWKYRLRCLISYHPPRFRSQQHSVSHGHPCGRNSVAIRNSKREQAGCITPQGIRVKGTHAGKTPPSLPFTHARVHIVHRRLKHCCFYPLSRDCCPARALRAIRLPLGPGVYLGTVKLTSVVREMLRPERWSLSARRRKLRGRSHFPALHVPDNEPGLISGGNAGVALLAAALHEGCPDEGASDACLAQATEAAGAPACAVSERCQQAVFGPRRSRGYPLAHRLLYVQVARQSGCVSLDTRNIDDLGNNFCLDVYADAQLIESLDFPLFARDMFCEAVALCGFEGFQEFTKPEWINQILSWQRPIGCFGDRQVAESFDNINFERIRRRKRSEGLMAFDCLMHFTGVATAAMAVGITSLLDARDITNV